MEFYLIDLIKAENPEAYKKLAERGIMVGFPAKVMGQEKRPDIGIPYHSTVKFFNPDKDMPSDIHAHASKLQLTPPDPKKTHIEPGILKDRTGNDIYVIKLHGPHADEIKAHNKAFSHMGFPQNFEYQPHVSVDKATWQKIVDSKAKTAHEAGIEFGPAQLRQGHNVLATYPHAPRKEEPLAASEEASLEKGLKGDWSKEPGYKVHWSEHVAPTGHTYHKAIVTHDRYGHDNPDKNHIADFEFHPNKDGTWVGLPAVNEGHKRKGIASSIYSQFEQRTGNKLVPDPGGQTSSAKALWANPNRSFGKSEEEPLEKGAIKNIGAALGTAAALTVATPSQSMHPAEASAISQPPAYDSREMLRTIANVESQNGKQMDHDAVNGPLHHGEKAYGRYALMPNTIRETIGLNADLKAKHKRALMLHGQDLHRYMQDNPELEDQVAQKHLQRLEHHFGQNPSAIGYAWLEGIRGTYRAQKEHKDIENHWHVKKVKHAYGKGT